jgi:GTP-binding protein Era
MQEHPEKPIKSGMVTLVGPPNVGKSTLLNSLLGQKISIVSPKPQTTRNRILGIINGDDYQIVMLDTPGIHDAEKPLNLEMVKIALSTLTEADVILFMIDVTLPLPKPETASVRHLKDAGRPAMLLINKIDLVAREALLPIIAAYQKMYPFTAIIPVSARLGDGTERIIGEIHRLLPEGPRLYPEDIPTDATERFIVAEIIREKIFLKTGEEVPYATAVVVDSFKEDPARMQVVIHATIFVEKQSQKGIVIGKNGRKLKEIGTAAREDMESLLGLKVVLKLWVKVQKDWTRDRRFLREFGFGGIS